VPNAAKDLHDLLSKWSPVPAQKTSEGTRGAAGDRLAFWRERGERSTCCLPSRSTLPAWAAHGDDVEHYIEALPTWYRAIFSVDAPWGSTHAAPRPIIDAGDLRLLRALGGALDAVRAVQPLLEEQVDGMLTALAKAEEAVRVATDVDDQIRRFLLGLISEARRVTKDWQTFGTEAVRSANLELGGALYTMADQTPEPASKVKWRSLAKDLVLPVMTGGLTHAAITGVSAVVPQLGGG
jgi:hypothetical protein